MASTSTLDWVPVSELRVGDLVRLPEGEGVGSRVYWRDRESAECAEHVPFRRVERVQVGEPLPGHGEDRVAIWLEHGAFHHLPTAAHVLRRERLGQGYAV